jgi:PelA/Pel-15E family pectate lyase
MNPMSFRFPLMVCAASLLAGSAVAAAPAPQAWPAEPQFLPVTAQRIAALPAAEQGAWRDYLRASEALAARIPTRAAFVTPSTERLQGAGIPGKHSRGLRFDATPEWYASEAAARIADRVVEEQSAAGAWTKGNDYTQPHAAHAGEPDVWSGGTLDNDATSWELRFLARAAAHAGDAAKAAAWRAAFLRGLNYLYAAQYPNGGFPQIYPLAGGYHDAITFNDDAMVQALELLRDIAAGQPEFAFVPAELRAKAAPAVARGTACILATQLRDAAGRRTVWCQQHDALTLKACAARNFEPVAACTNESASLVRFLMASPRPEAEVKAAIDGAMAWFKAVALREVAWSRAGGVGQLVARPGAPLLWARMYEIGTNRPIFGDRDRTVHYVFEELSSERRNGYAWYGTWPAAALDAYEKRKP